MVSPTPATAAANGANAKSHSPAAADASNKRKRVTEPKYYAVRIGHKPGVYHTWKDCLEQVRGYKGPIFRAFPTLTEAEAFLAGKLADTAPKHAGFYAVQSGRVPGVYTDWPSVQAQIIGWTKPKHRKFDTQAEAEAFVKAGQVPQTTAGPAPSKMRRTSEASTVIRDGLPGAAGMTIDDPRDPEGNVYDAGDGPLPRGATDGFDPNVLLNPGTGQVVYKTPQQRTATKPQKTAGSPPGMLKIYTDGSALGGGRVGARAGVGVYFGPNDDRNLSAPLAGPRQTNQRAELTAILRAIDIAPRHRHITIFTDSQYAIKCVTEWFINWRRNDWMTSNKKPVENRDLVERVLVKIDERNMLGVKTLFQWVKGHAGDEGNTMADQLAVKGASMERVVDE